MEFQNFVTGSEGKMRLCVLYSGGKDSNLALLKAVEEHEVVCLLSLKPESESSEVFHHPNVEVTSFQAKALGIPLISISCSDEEKKSLTALERGLAKAKEKFDVEGIVTGAIRSTYQATRFQRVCKKLELWCFNPLWLRDEISLLEEIVKLGFETIIVRVAGLPKDFLGKRIDKKTIEELKKMKGYVNPAGEGGEYETLVLYMPLFRRKLKVVGSEVRESELDATLKVRVELC